MRLNLRQVEAFWFVFQTGSMTTAAELMGVTQPAVSRLIRDFEAETQLVLFERHGGSISTTPDAVALFDEVQRSFHGLEQIERTAQSIRQAREGSLQIASTAAPSCYCLPKVLSDFHSKWPDTRLGLKVCRPSEILELVSTHQCDLGITVVPDNAQGIVIEHLPTIELVCVLPNEHELARHSTILPEHLDGIPLLVLTDQSLLQQQIIHCLEEAEIEINIVFEASFSAPICAMVANGVGVSILDSLTATSFMDGPVTVRRFKPTLLWQPSLIYQAGRTKSKPLSTFASLLQSHLTELTSTIHSNVSVDGFRT